MTENLTTAGLSQENGLAYRRPIMAGACPTCIWGPIAVLTRQALVAYGYDIQICYNCNRQLSVPSVARAMETPPLNKWDVILGDPPPPKGKVDFGVTNSHTLWRAFTGDGYADGPQPHLRLIAYIEDLQLIQAAARRSLGLTSLEDIASRQVGITLLLDGSPFIPPILAYYGLDRLDSWGGTIKHGFGGENANNRDDFDVVINAHGGLAGNIENDLLYEVTQKFDLQFLELAPELMTQLSQRFLLEIVPVPIGLLKGIDKPMTTLARNGQSVFGRQDLADDFAYAVARALDENRSGSNISTARISMIRGQSGKGSAACRCTPAPSAITAKHATCRSPKHAIQRHTRPVPDIRRQTTTLETGQNIHPPGAHRSPEFGRPGRRYGW